MSRNASIVVVLSTLLMCYFLFCCIQTTAGDTSIAQLDELIKEKKQNYNKLLRPILNQSDVFLIQMAFDLIAIRDFDEVAEKFSVVGTVYMIWKDENMAWEPKDYGDLYTFIIDSGDYWTPPFIIVNAFEKFEKVGEDSYWPIRFYHTGDTVYHPGQVFTTTCSVDVTFYPWDTQACSILFTVWGFGPEEIYLHPFSNYTKVSLTYFSENGEWELVDTAAGNQGNNLFYFTFIMKRKPLFIVINTLIPIVFMSLLNIIAFLIPIDSGERISYCITVLLALAVFLTLIGDTMPRSGTTIAVLCYYLVCVLALSVFIIFTSVISMRIHSRSETNRVSSQWCAFVRVVTCRKCCRQKCRDQQEKKSKQTNKLANYMPVRDKCDGAHFRENPDSIKIILTETLSNSPQHSSMPSKNSVTSTKSNSANDVNGPNEDSLDSKTIDSYDQVTWKDVSVAMDIIFGLISSVCLLVFTMFFFVYTIQNS